jgi:hypothetical protein
MPKGIVTVRWDDTQGTVLKAKHPQDLQLTADEMMRIFTSHAMGEGRAGFMSMKLEAMNIASYYTGLAARGEPQYFIALVLGSDEDAGIFEEPLTETAKDLLKKLDSSSYHDFLVKGYDQLSAYVKLTGEQRLAMIMLDPVRKLIFKRLTEGSLSKIELQEWLEQELGTQVSDLDLLLVPLLRANLVKKAVVEGMTGDSIFLVRDMFAALVPPETIMTRILRGDIKGDIARTGRSLISDFFKKRTSSEEDAGGIPEILTNNELYEVIIRLRIDVLGEEELGKQLNKSLKEVEKPLRNLMKIGIVGELSSKDEDSLFILKADPQIQVFYPEYMIDRVRAKWASGEISKEMALKHLKLLRDEYLA